jgi:hypothetical protein
VGNAIVTFNLRKGTIVVEGPTEDLTRLFEAARSVVPALREIRVIATDADADADAVPESTSGASDVSEYAAGLRRYYLTNTSVARFAKRVSASNMSERIAVLAFHAIRRNGYDHFTVDDMTRWFGLCEFTMPSNMNAAMADAQRLRGYKYVENFGRNQWTITPKGERLVRGLIDMTEEKDAEL